MNKKNFISKHTLSQFGLDLHSLDHYETLEELRKHPINIVVADCLRSVTFIQNHFRPQKLIKKDKYVMGLGFYNQLCYDQNRNIKILKPANFLFKNIYHPYLGEDLTNKKLLVFRTGGIGDLLFIQPNLTYLKKQYPSCTIIFACGPQYQSMVADWDCVDQIIDLPFSVRSMFSADYHCIFEGVIERCKESETTCAYNLFSKWMNLNLPDELLIPKQTVNEDCLNHCKDILKEFNVNEKDFIILQPSASSYVRTPPFKLWSKLIDMLTEKGHTILITDSPHKANQIDKLISMLKNKDKVFNFSNYSKTISDTIAMTSLAKMAIGPDSALNHVAISVGTKTFGIFGPFPGKVRLSIYPKNLCDWIDVEKECAPCFSHREKCEKADGVISPCYNNLNYDEALKKIENLLNK